MIRIHDPDPDPLVRSMDPRIRIHPKMSWIRNTGNRRSLHLSKENIQQYKKTLNFLTFFPVFVGHFCLPGAANSNECESGSATLTVHHSRARHPDPPPSHPYGRLLDQTAGRQLGGGVGRRVCGGGGFQTLCHSQPASSRYAV